MGNATLKKSDVIRQLIQEEESDYKAMTLNTKLGRELRMEDFEANHFPVINSNKNVSYISKRRDIEAYSIQIKGNGTLDYYPKSDRLLIRSSNRWVSNGLKWLNDHLKKNN